MCVYVEAFSTVPAGGGEDACVGVKAVTLSHGRVKGRLYVCVWKRIRGSPCRGRIGTHVCVEKREAFDDSLTGGRNACVCVCGKAFGASLSERGNEACVCTC